MSVETAEHTDLIELMNAVLDDNVHVLTCLDKPPDLVLNQQHHGKRGKKGKQKKDWQR